MNILSAALAFCAVISPARGQEANPTGPFPQKPTLEDRLPDTVKKADASFLTATIENDKFGNGTDRNYTNGVRLTYFDYAARPQWLAHFLEKYVPVFKTNETTSLYYSIGQNLYTPDDITLRNPDPRDRPYAAFLYGSAGFTTLRGNHIDELEATIGVVGPWAQGQEIQTYVHKLKNVDEPEGWDEQIKNEPGLMLSWQRQWPEAYATEIGDLNFRLSPHAAMTIGNIYTYTAGGLSFQLTPSEYKWQSKPLRVRPAIPGSGFFTVPDDRFAWSVFGGVEQRLMGRNIFLDGNTFRNSASVDKRHFVTDANAGLSLTYGRTQISYTLNWRSREFEHQDDPSVFGAVSIGRRF